MQIVKYNPNLYKKLLPAELKTEQAGLINLVQHARNGGAIRDIRCNPNGEEFAGQDVSTDEEKKRMLIGMLLINLASAFGVNGEIPGNIMSKCITFVHNAYSAYSLKEIDNAFDLAASGDLGDIKVSLYQSTINIEWISRIMRAYVSRRQKVLAGILEAEEELDSVLNADVEKIFQDRNASNLATINAICDEYSSYCDECSKMVNACVAGHTRIKIPIVDLKIYIYDFAGKIGAIAPKPRDMRNAFNKSEDGAIKKMQENKLLAESNKSISFLANHEITTMQESVAMCRLISAWFAQMWRSAVSFSQLKEFLVELYSSQADRWRVKYNVHMRSFGGNTHDKKGLNRRQLDQLLGMLSNKIISIKIKLA